VAGEREAAGVEDGKNRGAKQTLLFSRVLNTPACHAECSEASLSLSQKKKVRSFAQSTLRQAQGLRMTSSKTMFNTLLS
jgi:Fe-S-cluster-containing hydrogenase component 2